MTVFQKRLLSCLMPSLSSKFCSSVLKPNLGLTKVKFYKYVEWGEFASQLAYILVTRSYKCTHNAMLT